MNAPAPTAKRLPGRGRPGGRTAFQEEKRRQTRAAILAAAGDVFSATPYVYATIDDIIRAAGISRATFYMHFESKLALALAIYDGIAADWQGLFDRLATGDGRDASGLKAWVGTLAALYVDHGYVTSLVGQLEIFEPSFRQRLHDDRDALIDRLSAAGVGGFAMARGETPAQQIERARAHLLLRRIDQVCGDVSVNGALSTAEAAIYVDLLVKEMAGFITGRA
ncbi:transcriptional regulator, TetR family [Sphingomonas laterariae]|uniref:Transcriptional regulator, TetR family n=1 Tax=Edaphosphingomonas laterariae TaxID=861865 RepID=A0A239FWA5_9SPHN|nr:TetR/AcrR family transcriptional regulator [Sphingomonas laterariae]SNS61060.1 transcriptional regulator, TetR family [Sphingomonas laterariae]